MHGVLTIRVTLLGLVSWLVPFLLSFLFFDQAGQLVIPQPLFKSLMVVVFGAMGTAMLAVAFRRITPSCGSGLMLGCYWLVINLVLDLLVLLPLAKMPITLYFYDIGLRYVLIPVISTGMGIVSSWVAARSAA
jgi:hypothetical protein